MTTDEFIGMIFFCLHIKSFNPKEWGAINEAEQVILQCIPVWR
jgi:hypothetical protein